MERRGEGGITLIEVAVVMAIVAIAAVFMTPAIGEWIDNFRIRQAGREMSADLQFAKMKAISSKFVGKYCTVKFDVDVGGTHYDYIIFPDYNNDLQLDGDVADLDGDSILENETNDMFKKVSLIRNVSFDTTRGVGNDGIDFKDNSVAFDRRGLPRDDSGFVSAEQSVFLKNTKNNKCREVTITPAGRISINEY